MGVRVLNEPPLKNLCLGERLSCFLLSQTRHGARGSLAPLLSDKAAFLTLCIYPCHTQFHHSVICSTDRWRSQSDYQLSGSLPDTLKSLTSWVIQIEVGVIFKHSKEKNGIGVENRCPWKDRILRQEQVLKITWFHFFFFTLKKQNETNKQKKPLSSKELKKNRQWASVLFECRQVTRQWFLERLGIW